MDMHVYVAKDGDSLLLNMVYGRKDCSEDTAIEKTTDQYPSPHGDYNSTTGYFGRQFGLTADETVALLGESYII